MKMKLTESAVWRDVQKLLSSNNKLKHIWREVCSHNEGEFNLK